MLYYCMVALSLVKGYLINDCGLICDMILICAQALQRSVAWQRSRHWSCWEVVEDSTLSVATSLRCFVCLSLVHLLSHVAWLWLFGTRKPSCCWQTRVTWKHAQYILIVTHSGGMPSNINEIYTSMKSTFSGLQFCRWQCGSIYIRLAVVAFQMYEIARNSKKIRTYSSSRSSKVINLGANRKLISNFPSVINSNEGRISHCFRDIPAES